MHTIIKSVLAWVATWLVTVQAGKHYGISVVANIGWLVYVVPRFCHRQRWLKLRYNALGVYTKPLTVTFGISNPSWHYSCTYPGFYVWYYLKVFVWHKRVIGFWVYTPFTWYTRY